MQKKNILLICLIIFFIFITTLVIFNKINFIDSSVYNFLISFNLKLVYLFVYYLSFVEEYLFCQKSYPLPDVR